MGMLTAMWAGVAGLNVHGQALSAVADNVANVNTHGYKASRVNFGDVMIHSLTVGGTVVSQVGTGAKVLSVQNLLTQGSFETTDVPTDMAINGGGFFQVNNTSAGQTAKYYTRAGQFLLDIEGYMVNPQGYRLQGYNVDANGQILAVPADLRITTVQTDAIATSSIDISMNLNSEDTKKLHPSQLISPSDQSTWNYVNTTRTYDSLGVGHNLSMFYQRLSSYSGTKANGATSFWKVTAFESVNGVYHPNEDDYATTAEYLEAVNAKTYYLQFDTSGHLVGVSTGDSGYGDTYVYGGKVSSSTSDIATALGGQLTFNGAGASDQVIRTSGTVTFAGTGTTSSTSVTVGADAAYTLADGLTPAQAAAELCDQINGASPAVNYYAVNEGSGVVTIHAKNANGPFDLSVSHDSSTEPNFSATGDDTTTLSELANMINAGNASSGALQIDTTGMADDATITVGGVTFSFNGGGTATGANPWTTLADLATAITANVPNVTATYTAGGSISLAYDSVGVAGNAVTLAMDLNGGGGSIDLSGATLTNGWDGTTTGGAHAVVASAKENSDGTYSLQLTRNVAGAGSTYTIDVTDFLGSNTLGSEAGVGFTTATQTTVARDETNGVLDLNGQVELNYYFEDAVQPQAITIDYSPTASAASTQSAGSNETFYLYQNGSTRGTLQSLDIGADGVITGTFSNGQLKTLGQVMLVDFANPEGLAREGDNLWSQTTKSGEPIENTPGQGGTGSIESGALEQSNVDLATEMVKMILYQRAYQANSKSISTTDQMLQELINLKR